MHGKITGNLTKINDHLKKKESKQANMAILTGHYGQCHVTFGRSDLIA